MIRTLISFANANISTISYQGVVILQQNSKKKNLTRITIFSRANFEIPAIKLINIGDSSLEYISYIYSLRSYIRAA